MPADPQDAAVWAFIRSSQAQTVSEIAAELVDRFGPARAWPADLVRDAILSVREQRRGWHLGYADDPAIVAFIMDRVGLVNMEEIAKLGAAQFAPARFPSSSSVHRIIRKERRCGAAAKG